MVAAEPSGPPVRLLIVLAVVALVARAVAAVVAGDAPYLDVAYYQLVAERLAGGHGLTVPVLWSFLEVGGQLPPDPVLPVPSNRHWMPLTSLISSGPMVLLGASRLAGQLPMIIMSAALVPLTALVTWELSRSRRLAGIAGLLAIFAGPMLILGPQIDNFAAFGVAGFGALYAAMHAAQTTSARTSIRWLVLSGALCGVATLARVDGVLLVVAPIVAWLVRRGRSPDGSARDHVAAPWLIGAVLAGVLVLGPWLIRQWLTFGSPFPSAGGHTLWITSFNDQFSISRTFDLGSYLSWGVTPIITSKLESWITLLGRTAVLLGGVFLAPFLFGMWRERRRAGLAPVTAYWVVMFVAMGGAFTFHAPQGAYYHSAPAWLPFAIAIAVSSFQPMLAGIGARWRLLSRPRNQRFMMAAGVGGAILISVLASSALLVTWRADRALVEHVAPFFRSEDRADDMVMYLDPPSLYLLTGNPAISPPYDPFPVIGDAARAYGARWLIVERSDRSGSDPLGLWDGGQSIDAAGNRASWLESEPAFEFADVRIFEISESSR